MADYVSILRRTLDGLGDKATPSLRERVYSRARDAVKRQLDGMNPPPAEDVVAKQYDNLERAIAEVEAAYAAPATDDAPQEPPAAGVAQEPAPEPAPAPVSEPPVAAPEETRAVEAAPVLEPAAPAPSDDAMPAAPESEPATSGRILGADDEAGNVGEAGSVSFDRPGGETEEMQYEAVEPGTAADVAPPADGDDATAFGGTRDDHPVEARPDADAAFATGVGGAGDASGAGDVPPVPASFESLSRQGPGDVPDVPPPPPLERVDDASGAPTAETFAAVSPTEDMAADYGVGDVPAPPADLPSNVADQTMGAPASLAETIRDGSYFEAQQGSRPAAADLDPSLFATPDGSPAAGVDDTDVPRLPRADTEAIGDDLDALRAKVGKPPAGASEIAPPAEQPPLPSYAAVSGAGDPHALATPGGPVEPAPVAGVDAAGNAGPIDPVPPAVDPAVAPPPIAAQPIGAPLPAAGAAAVAGGAAALTPRADGTVVAEPRIDRIEAVPARQERKGRGGLVLGSLVVIAGALGAGWAFRGELADTTGVEGFRTAFGLEEMLGVAPGEPDGTVTEPVVTENADDAAGSEPIVADVPDAAEEPAVAEPPADQGTVDVAATQPDKFEDRLPGAETDVDAGADNPVVDVAPADDDASVRDVPTVATDGDGTPAADDPATQGEAADADPVAPDAPSERLPEEVASADPVAPVVPEGDARGFLVEEPVGGQPVTPQTGAVNWSVAQESPGGDLPDEPAIRGDVTLPNGVSVSVTVRRNADEGLPASHIIELVFAQPETGEPLVVQRVPVVGFKDSLQVAARPLVAVPAQITDDFHIVGLNNFDTAVESNLALMREEDFMDVQMLYGNGRRATMTLEKGAKGSAVFEEVLAAWAAAPLPG